MRGPPTLVGFVAAMGLAGCAPPPERPPILPEEIAISLERDGKLEQFAATALAEYLRRSRPDYFRVTDQSAREVRDRTLEEIAQRGGRLPLGTDRWSEVAPAAIVQIGNIDVDHTWQRVKYVSGERCVRYNRKGRCKKKEPTYSTCSAPSSLVVVPIKVVSAATGEILYADVVQQYVSGSCSGTSWEALDYEAVEQAIRDVSYRLSGRRASRGGPNILGNVLQDAFRAFLEP